MRIVAGTLRGRALVAPKGQSTRPTTDRARQALFNVLEHAAWSPGLEGVRVIDLFAGSGALGLEALSRGAAECLFVETDSDARLAIESNIEALGLKGRAQTLGRDASKMGSADRSADSPFDLAFLDPPYGRGLNEAALAGLAAGGWLTDRALVVVERGADEAPLTAAAYETLDVRPWGAARVTFLSFRGLSPSASMVGG